MKEDTELSVDNLEGVQAGYNKTEYGVEAAAKNPKPFLGDRLASDMKFFDIGEKQENAQQDYGNHRLNNLGGGVIGVGRRVVETTPVDLHGRRMPGSEGVRDAIEYTLNGDIDFGIAAVDPDTAIQMAQYLNKTSEQGDTSALGRKGR